MLSRPVRQESNVVCQAAAAVQLRSADWMSGSRLDGCSLLTCVGTKRQLAAVQLRAAAAEERAVAAEARLTQRQAAMAASLAASERAATIGDGLTQARFACHPSRRGLG